LKIVLLISNFQKRSGAKSGQLTFWNESSARSEEEQKFSMTRSMTGKVVKNMPIRYLQILTNFILQDIENRPLEYSFTH